MSRSDTEAPPRLADDPTRAGSSDRSSPRRDHTHRVALWFFRLTALGLIAFNAWRLALDLAPVPNPRAIGALMREGRYDEAERALRRVLRRSPRDGSARMQLARTLAARDDYLAAARELHVVPEWWPSKREALFLEGESYRLVGLARPAEAAWKACIADDPLHPTPDAHLIAAVEQLIELYATEERWDEARAVAWETYRRLIPSERPDVVFMLLRTRVERIADETRAQRLRAYVEADPEDYEARLALASVEQTLGNAAEATRHALACLDQRPDDPRSWRTWLDLLERRGDREGLVEAIGRLPRSTDEDARIWQIRGRVLEGEGDFARAAESYKRALDLDPFEYETHYHLALCEHRLGHTAEAERLLARSRELREAREGLLEAFQDYLDAHTPSLPDPKQLESSRLALATICRTLGWEDLAEVL